MQIKQEPELIISENFQERVLKIYRCSIGGIESTFCIETLSSVNVMSSAEFKRLRIRNFSFHTSDMIPVKVDGFDFLGQFTSQIEVNGKFRFVNFYMQESSREFVILNRKMGNYLDLPCE